MRPPPPAAPVRAPRPCRHCGARERYESGTCAPCDRRRALEKARADPDRHAFLRARQKYVQQYDLTAAQAEVALVNARGGLCDACGDLGPLVMDHVHRELERKNWNAYRTGSARGMVCRGCNVVAGALERGNASRSPRLPAVGLYLVRTATAPAHPSPGTGPHGP